MKKKTKDIFMEKPKLKNLSKGQLENKARSLKVFIGVFMLLIIALFSFIIRDYLNGAALDWSMLTIAICTLMGPVTIYPELKEFQEELRTRS